MERVENVHARSGSVLIEGDIAVLSFLAALDGHANVAVSMPVHVLEQLQSRIERALAARPPQTEGLSGQSPPAPLDRRERSPPRRRRSSEATKGRVR